MFAFWYLTPCRSVKVCRRFRRIFCLRHQCGSIVQRRYTFTKLHGVVSQATDFLVTATNFKHLIPGVQIFPQKMLQPAQNCRRQNGDVKHFPCTFFSWRNSPQWRQGLFIIEASRSHSDTSQSVRLLWITDWPVAENST
jgi:hypothetical protein